MSERAKKILAAALSCAIALLASAVQMDVVPEGHHKLATWVAAALGLVNSLLLPAVFGASAPGRIDPPASGSGVGIASAVRPALGIASPLAPLLALGFALFVLLVAGAAVAQEAPATDRPTAVPVLVPAPPTLPQAPLPIPVVIAGEVQDPSAVGTIQVCADIPGFTPRQRRIVTWIGIAFGSVSAIGTLALQGYAALRDNQP